jgi:hypothetical protein
LLQKWFPLQLKTKLPKSNLDDEDNDLEFFNLDLEMKSTTLEMPTQGASIDLDSMPNV